MKKILLLTFGLCALVFAKAQDSPAALLQKTVDKINSAKSISYSDTSADKNLFSEGDTTHNSLTSVLLLDGHGKLKAVHDEINLNGIKCKTIFKKDTLYQANLMDSTYSFYPKPEQSIITNGVIFVRQSITDNLNKKTPKIFQHKDTLINNTKCYGFFIIDYDTIYNGHHDYTNIKLFINKGNNMPVMYYRYGAGVAERDGHVIGRVTDYSKMYFSNFKFNSNPAENEFTFETAKFSSPNKNMLADGDKAPPLKLTSIESTDTQVPAIQSKVLLIEFGDTGCSANALANPMLNRINEKYAASNFSIACIYTGETTQQAKSYIKTNGIKFPVYLTDLKTKKSFKTMGTPGFYLLDKNGVVLMSSNGYSDELEGQLSAKIDQALKNN